jgi:hypothetical protein
MSGSNNGDGVVRIESGSPLTRLHFFDGKYLRADALTTEQDYHREMVRQSNLAGGWGVVHGLGLGQVGATLAVTPGLAITPTGRFALLTGGIEVPVADLIAAAQAAPKADGKAGFGDCAPAATAAETDTAGQGIYEVTVGPAQALCGSEEVFGRLCADACVTDTERPYWREGLVLRLRPVTLSLPTSSAVPFGAVHLRSRVVSAYFAQERGLPAPLLSAQGLASGTWCGPASLFNRDEVPIGLIVREGTTLRVLDAWAARRERMEAQARSYWQGRMRMRPWNVFLAQVLQFQCQLSGLFSPGSPVFTPQADDDCVRLRKLLAESLKELEAARKGYESGNARILSLVGADRTPEGADALGRFSTSFKRIEALAKKLGDAQASLGTATPNRMLIQGGIVQLPPAGYLPVIPGQLPVNLQLQRTVGEGVALTYCAVPLDHLGHLLEEAQHMDRISLTRGLDDPRAREQVEIFVPDGEVIGQAGDAGGIQWSARLISGVLEDAAQAGLQAASTTATADEATAAAPADAIPAGAAAAAKEDLANGFAARARTEALTYVSVQSRLVGIGRSQTVADNGGMLVLLLRSVTDPKQDPAEAIQETTWMELRLDGDPFVAQPGDELPARIEQRRLREGTRDGVAKQVADILSGDGRMTIVAGPFPVAPGEVGVRVRLTAPVTLRAVGSTREEKPLTLRFELTLNRRGDAAAGRVLIEPRRQFTTAGSFALAAEWGGTPREATFGAQGRDVVPVELSEIPALAPESPARLQAIGALEKLGAATEDDAFAVTARRKLFADAAVPAGQSLLRATRDFVLFRRKRVCCGGAADKAAPVIERFVVLHAKLPNADVAKSFQEALAKGDSGALLKFDIARVQVLRYADGSQMPEESTAEILRAWQAADPGPRLLLGRVWEVSPATGQGWQNHARLKRLLEVVDGLIAPPATGQLEALPAPPAGLGDPAFDGGMLIATVAEAPAQLRTHNAYLMDSARIEQVRSEYDKAKGSAAWFNRTVKLAIATVPVRIAGGMPNGDDVKAILEKSIGNVTQGGHMALVEQGNTAPAQVLDDHAAICKGLEEATGVGVAPASEVSPTKVASFGTGVTGASILFVAPIG